MIKFNKTFLFSLILLMSICAGISFTLVDWDKTDSTLGFFKEIHLTFLFIGIALYFVFPYVKSLKESK